MNLDKFKAGSWWLLEQKNRRWIFMVSAHIKRSDKPKFALSIWACSPDVPSPTFTKDSISPNQMSAACVFTPLPSRQAALDLLHIIRRNHEQ